jgi:hypothetical protein
MIEVLKLFSGGEMILKFTAMALACSLYYFTQYIQ